MFTRREFFKGAAGVAAAALLTLITGGCKDNSAPLYSHTIDRMTAEILEKMEKNGVPGLSIALVDDQNVVWIRGFGYSNTADKTPATADTLYEIGSISKVFAATLVMQLVERGSVNLDDPLTKHLPSFSLGQPLGNFPAGSREITIRSILTHHSGIPGDIWNGVFATVFYPDFNLSLLDILRDDHAHYPPDFFLMYSNTAVSFLADVIASASGQSFKDRSDAFFTALGMAHTSFFSDSPTVAANRAKGYFEGQAYGPFYENTPAAGSMISSVRDVAKFIQMMNAGGVSGGRTLLRPETVDAMVSRQNGSVFLDFDFQIGFIWKLTDPDMAYAGRLCQHSGDRLTFQSYMEILNDRKLGVIVLGNSVESGSIHSEIAQKTLKLALEEKTGLKQPTTPYVPAPSPIDSWSRDRLDALAGIYTPLEEASIAGTSPSRSYSRIDAVDGGLTWTRDAASPTEFIQNLVPRKNGWFSVQDSQDYQYEFMEAQGRLVMVQHSLGASYFLAERYVPVAIPAAWSARVGTYELANLDPNDWSNSLPENLHLISSSLKLHVENGVPVIELLKGLYKGRLVVSPVSDTLGYMPGGGRNLAGSVQFVIVNGEERLEFLGLQYKRL